MKFILLIIVIVFTIFLCVDSTQHKQQQHQTDKLLNKKDECFDFIPESIRDSVYIIKPDRGGLIDQTIKSIPEQYRNKIGKDNKQDSNFNNTTRYYLLKQLESNTQYAIRISYPASSPTDYIIKFFDNPLITPVSLYKFKMNKDYNKPSKSRDLLNTEIIKFKTDDGSYVIESDELNKFNPCSIISINAINLGVTPKHVKNDGFKYQSFDLIMDTELIGIPPQIPKLVIIVVSTLLIVFIIVKKMMFNK